MKSSNCYSLLLSFVLLLSVNGLGQASSDTHVPDKAPTVPLFRAQSKLVIGYVVVSDKSGKAVTGLKASDFQLSENGMPQQVSVFEEHSLAPRSPRAKAPPLQPNQYTNLPVDPPRS
jgi:hypothetical protein